MGEVFASTIQVSGVRPSPILLAVRATMRRTDSGAGRPRRIRRLNPRIRSPPIESSAPATTIHRLVGIAGRRLTALRTAFRPASHATERVGSLLVALAVGDGVPGNDA